jgi:hypothetical protein
MCVTSRIAKIFVVLTCSVVFFSCNGAGNSGNGGTLVAPCSLTLDVPYTGSTPVDDDGISVYSLHTTVGTAYTVKLTAKSNSCGMYIFSDASSWDDAHVLWHSTYYNTGDEKYTFVAKNELSAFVVEAEDSSGSVTHTITVSEVPRPAAPENFAAKATSTTLHYLTWSAVSGATEYRIYYSASSGVGLKDSVIKATGTSDSHSSASTCYYVITAVVNSMESLPSAEISCGPYADAPTNFTGVASDGQVLLSWNPVYNATSYKLIYTYIASGTRETLTVEGVSSPYTVAGLANGVQYDFYIMALNQYGGLYTALTLTPNTIPATPASVRATSSTTYNTIQWASVAGITQSYNYNVYYSTTSGAGKNGT